MPTGEGISRGVSTLNTGFTERHFITYALGIFSPFVAIVCTGVLPQLWTIAYKADLSQTMTVLLLIGIWDLLNDYIIGYVQDKQMLDKFMDREKWGRRASWLVTHLPGLQICVLLLFIVPSSMTHPEEGDNAIYIYLAVVTFIMRWCTTQVYTAYKGGIIEIYASSADRLRLEFWLICFAWLAALFVILALGAVIADGNDDENCIAPEDTSAGNETSATADSSTGEEGNAGRVIGIVFFFMMFSGYVCVPILKTARRKADPNKVGSSMFSFLGHLFTDKACIVYYSCVLLSEFHSTVNGALYVFYIQYVSEEDREGTAGYSTLVGLFGMVSQILFGLFLKMRFAKGDRPRLWAVSMRLVYSVFMPVATIIPGNFSAGMFVICYVVERFAYAPQTYWATMAKGLLADEDSLKEEGQRREGMFVGMHHLVSSFIAILVTLFIMSLDTIFGLDTQKCWGDPQPESAVNFLKYTFTILLPFLGLILSCLIYFFPIHGERLETLERKLVEAKAREGHATPRDTAKVVDAPDTTSVEA